MTTEKSSVWAVIWSTGKVVLSLVVAAIALRMLIGLILLALKLVGLTAVWLQDGAPLDLPSLGPGDFIIPGIVLILYCLPLLNRHRKSTESDDGL